MNETGIPNVPLPPEDLRAASQSDAPEALPPSEAENLEAAEGGAIEPVAPDGEAESEQSIRALGGAVATAQAARQPRASTVMVAACIIALVALTMLGGVLNVGDHLGAAHPVLGGVFYALIAVLVVVGIIRPIVNVAKRPIFSLYELRDEQGHAKRRRCRMLADNLTANTDLTDDEVAELENILQQGDRTDDALIDFFNAHCIPLIDTETKRAASTAFFISAVSRSPLISTVTMLSVCLDLVRAIVEVCGFRPTNVGLARLYTRVMISALIIGGVEDSDLSDLLGQLMGGGAGARVGGIVMGTTAEGLVSAFLVFRVGVLTKKWLTAADGPVSMRAIRRTSYREALSLMRTSEFMQTVTDTMKEMGESVASSVANTVKETSASVANNITESVTGKARSAVDSAKAAVRGWHLFE